MSDETLNPEDFAEAASAAIRDAQTRPEATAAVLAEAGLFSVTVPEEAGGMGLALDFALPVARAAGALQLRFALVEQMLLAHAFAGTEIGGALLEGTATGTIAWRGNLAQGHAGHAAYGTTAQYWLIADGAAPGAGAVLIAAETLAINADAALDPEAPQGFATLEGAAPVARLEADAFAKLRAEATLLYAAYAIGTAESALDTTAAYLSARVQFGRPLTAKQAVRHHLARMKLATEVASATLRRALRQDEFGQPRAIETAFVSALSQGIFVVEKAIHLHGGMGFTWEVPLHYALRDLRRIDAALQTGQEARSLGRAFIDAA